MFLVFLLVPLPNKPPDMSPIFPGDLRQWRSMSVRNRFRRCHWHHFEVAFTACHDNTQVIVCVIINIHACESLSQMRPNYDVS